MGMTPYQELVHCLHEEVIGTQHKFSWGRLVRRYIKNQNIRFICWWRFASYIFSKGGERNKKRAYRINRKLVSKYGIEIELGAVIAPGITFAHFQGIVISRACIIGRNLHIRQNTTIGVKNGNGNRIIIGDNVELGANSCIIGENIKIGNNVTIGAMAFINKNIPDDSTCYTDHSLCIKSKHKLTSSALTSTVTSKRSA